MTSQPPLPQLLTIAIGGVICMYAVAFGQWAMLVPAAVATVVVMVFLRRQTPRSGQVVDDGAGFASVTSSSQAPVMEPSERAAKQQSRFARSADRDARRAARKANRRARAQQKADRKADVFGVEDVLPSSAGAVGRSVFADAAVNRDYLDARFQDDDD